jgi:hypothetical protein
MVGVNVKQRIHMRGAIAVLVLGLCALTGEAQAQENDICVLEHVKAKALTGKVVTARLDHEVEKPIKGAVVELRHIGQLLVIAKATTDSNGHFTLPDVAPGIYSLAAKTTASDRLVLFSTAVEVRLGRSGTEKNNKEIVLALGWLFNGCHGGYATMRNRNK